MSEIVRLPGFPPTGIARRSPSSHARPETLARTAASILVRALVAGWLLLVACPSAGSFPVHSDQSVLPAGSELNEDTLDQPREVFHSEAIAGAKSYLVKLGDLAFNSPSLLGDTARRAGISCGTCHMNGASNPKLYIPGLSSRPGTFDTTGALFNPAADNGVLDAVRIPSLRGARYLAPYGHDGRMSSLRDFIHNVIVNEFAGPEPSPAILDAMVAYIQDIDFLPNPSLGRDGRLTQRSSAAERRGEQLFLRPFPHDPGLSCAACHVPSEAFVDHRLHDVGSGGLFKTPTLRNADFNAPYFHDGRYDTYDQVVAHFDRVFGLGLSAQDKKDLVAYLTAVGDGQQAIENDGVGAELTEVDDLASVLGVAIPAHDLPAIRLAVETVGGELRELTEQFPERRDTTVSGGLQERGLARVVLKELVLDLRRVDAAAAAGRFEDADRAYYDYRKMTAAAAPTLLRNAEPWSLFNRQVHDAHYAALRKLLRTASGALP